MITIKNEFLTASFNTLGAELRSLIMNGREYIWQADPSVWPNSCPMMFPICGGLKDDEYEFEGKSYTLTKHGFAKLLEFEVEEQKENSLTFLLKSSDATRKAYPFEFELRVIYTLLGKSLAIRNEVKNLENKTMYFSIGSHEGYSIPEGVDNYELVFPQNEKLYSFALNGNLLSGDKALLMDGNLLPLKKEFFSVDAQVFPEIKSRSVILKKKGGAPLLRVVFDGFFNLMLWQKYNAPYICIEPWNGVPDRTWSEKKLVEKDGIQTVAGGETYIRTHSIELF